MADQLIRFGKLSLLYENGFVRYIRTGETEIVRNIYFALRDNNWVTAPIVRSDERISVTPKFFDISYTATNVIDNKQVFRWHVKIAGTRSGEIEFAVDGECLAPYNRNRAGICVLHPVRDTRSKPLHVTRPDGSVYETRFPSVINPHQPFFDIRKMSWPLVGDAGAELEFEGDVFETEDQRNWGDMSFKTYSTPLSIPYPIMLKRGDKVSQRVRLKLVNGDSLPAGDLAEDIEVTIDENASKEFPSIGTDFKVDDAALKGLHLDHLRIELDLSSPSWKEKLKTGFSLAQVIFAKVFVHVVMNSPDEWESLASADLPQIDKLAISPVDKKGNVDDLLRSVVPKARKLFPNAEIGAGFTSYFTELNRNRFDYKELDFVIYPVTPQAHLSDIHTVIENLPAQKDQLESAKAFAGGKNICVGPVSLTSVPDRLAAGWMLGSIKYLSEGGAHCVTMFESNGYLSKGPVRDALLVLKNLKPERVIASTCNEPLIITSLVIESEDRQRHLILINHTSANKSVSVEGELYTLTEYEIRFALLK
jgi:hypothetical protein